jgi:ABC-type transporter Mla subunit MlaD
MRILDQGRPIHRDATMKLRPRLFLEGSFFVDVRPGTTSAPELKNGETIPLSQTAIPVQLDQVLAAFDADTRDAQKTAIKGFADSLDKGGAKALNRGFADWAPAFLKTAVAMEASRGIRHDDLSTFVAGQARISAAFNDRRRDLGQFITSFRRTMDALADRQAGLRGTVRELERVVDVAPATLDDLDGALPPLRELAAALRPGLRIAPPVLDDSRPFLAALNRLVAPDALTAFARDLSPATQSLATLNRRLTPLLPLVGSVSRCVRDNIVPALSQEVPDGDLSTGAPAWLNLARHTVGLAGAQQNYTGAGFGTRYHGADAGATVVTQLGGPESLIGLSPLTILGARPKWTPGYQPPIRPDVPCEGQQVADLHTETVAAPRNARRVDLRNVKPWTRTQLRRHLEQALRNLKRSWR